MLAYSKMEIYNQILISDLVNDPYFTQDLYDIAPVPETWQMVGSVVVGFVLVALVVIAVLVFFTGLWIWSLLI